MIRFVHLRIESIETLAAGIVALTLVPLRAGMALPAFEPGAHIEIHLPTPGVPTARCYALVSAPQERHHYRIWVRGSVQPGGERPSAAGWLLHEAKPGQTLRVSAPRAHWALGSSPAPALFLAQGIGLAGVWAMLERRGQMGLPWALHWGVDECAEQAFGPQLKLLAARSQGAQIVLYRGPEEGLAARLLDAFRGAVQADLAPETEAYVCGPRDWLDSLAALWAPRPAEQLHTESFDAAEAQRRGGFVVKLARSGRDVTVKPGETILEAVLAAGVEAGYSCRSGHCGACEVKVLAGEPEHRDLVLSPEERGSGRMLICCSGSRTAELTLEL